MVTTRSSSSSTGVSRTRSSTPATSATTRSSTRGWTHAPGRLAIFWLAISLPLVAWDTGYVLLRPHSMPGGKWHKPLWTPYALYGQVDHVYGRKYYDAGHGFTSAQGSLNVVESLLYAAYLFIYYRHAVEPRSAGLRGAAAAATARGAKVLTGRAGGVAVLVGFSAAVMTVSKTVLYWLNEYFSNFDNIGHNEFMDLLFLWIIPNGAWLIFPTIMMFTMGGEIVDGLALASSSKARKSS